MPFWNLKSKFLAQILSALICVCILPAPRIPAKELLTAKEIERLQASQRIDVRVKIYLEFAESRLKAAEERLNGKESEEGDPFEYFTPEDMIEGYDRILNSVMLTLDDSFQKSDPLEKSRVQRALKLLKGAAERGAKQLEVLKKIAEEKKKEGLWDLVNQAIESVGIARQGAEEGISKEPDPEEEKPKRKNR